MKKAAIAIVLGVLFISSSAWAQYGYSYEKPEHKVEIIPMYGYVWTVGQSTTYSGYSGDVDIKSSGFWGIAVDIPAKPGLAVRLLYRRQDSEVTFKWPGDSQTFPDFGVEYWHVGGVGGVTKGNVTPYTSLSLGTTRYIAGGEDDYKFSIILSLGAKVMINEKIGLMVAGQMPWTFTDAFLGIGTGGLSFGGTGVIQLDVVGGLIIAL
jgi:hypothetical protein